MVDVADTRRVYSELTEITETTLQSIFAHESAREAALYRECPSAFWLAPEADVSFEHASIAPATPCAPTEVHDVDPPAPMPVMRSAIVRAMLAAGPIFTATWMAVGYAPGDGWREAISRAATSLFLAPLTILFGAALGVLPITAGACSLGVLGRKYPLLRRTGIWLGTGGTMGLLIAALFGADGPAGLALLATALACAGIAHHGIDWDTSARSDSFA